MQLDFFFFAHWFSSSLELSQFQTQLEQFWSSKMHSSHGTQDLQVRRVQNCGDGKQKSYDWFIKYQSKRSYSHFHPIIPRAMCYSHGGKSSIFEANTATYKVETHLCSNVGLPTGTIIELVDHFTILSGQLLLVIEDMVRPMNPLVMNTLLLFFSGEMSSWKDVVLYRILLWPIKRFKSLWMMVLAEYYEKRKLVYIEHTSLFLWEQNAAPFIIEVVSKINLSSGRLFDPLGEWRHIEAQLGLCWWHICNSWAMSAYTR